MPAKRYPKLREGTIKALVYKRLAQGWKDERIFKEIARVFPKSRFNRHHLYVYRCTFKDEVPKAS